MKDCVFLKDLQAFCRLGIYEIEHKLGQCLRIELELEFDQEKAGKTDSINDTINYVDVSITVRELAASRPFMLLENLAQEITDTLFKKFEILDAIKLEIHKNIVNADQFAGTPGIKVYRERK